MVESMRISSPSELQLSVEDREKIIQVTSELQLSVEDRERVAEVISELIAVNVYRELQRANDLKKASGSQSVRLSRRVRKSPR